MSLADTTHFRSYLPHQRPPASADAAVAAAEVAAATSKYGLHPHTAAVDFPPAVTADARRRRTAAAATAAAAAAAAAVAQRLHTCPPPYLP